MNEIQTRIEGEIRLEEIKAVQTARNTSLIASQTQEGSVGGQTKPNRLWSQKLAPLATKGKQTKTSRDLNQPHNLSIDNPTRLQAWGHIYETASLDDRPNENGSIAV